MNGGWKFLCNFTSFHEFLHTHFETQFQFWVERLSAHIFVPFNYTYLDVWNDVFIYELKLHGCIATRQESRGRETSAEKSVQTILKIWKIILHDKYININYNPIHRHNTFNLLHFIPQKASKLIHHRAFQTFFSLASVLIYCFISFLPFSSPRRWIALYFFFAD